MKLLGPTTVLSGTECQEQMILGCSDGKRFAVKKSTFLACSLIRDILAANDEGKEASDGPATGSSGCVEIPLEGIDSGVLHAVFEYLDHHSGQAAPKEIERPLSQPLKFCLESWDWKYADDTLLQGGSNQHFVFTVLKAASTLGLSELRDLCSACVAEALRAMSEEEILEFFGCPGGFSAEDEEQLCQDFPWLGE